MKGCHVEKLETQEAELEPMAQRHRDAKWLVQELS